MFDRKAFSIAAMILPVTFISTQGGVSVQNDVNTSGNSNVHVESQVQQKNSQSISIQTSNGTTVDKNSNSNTRMEITVNGKTKKLETDKPGTYRIDMNDNTTGSADISIQNDNLSPYPTINTNSKPVVHFTGKNISLGQYMKEFFKSLFSTIFSGFSKK